MYPPSKRSFALRVVSLTHDNEVGNFLGKWGVGLPSLALRVTERALSAAERRFSSLNFWLCKSKGYVARPSGYVASAKRSGATL
jgi:hypothetical protein